MPPFERSLERARRRNKRVVENTGRDENRFENLDTEFFRRTYEMYRTIADRDSVRVVAIESEGGIEEVFSSILKVVDERLNAFRSNPTQAAYAHSDPTRREN
jgi:thymidylate kinase